MEDIKNKKYKRKQLQCFNNEIKLKILKLKENYFSKDKLIIKNKE